jgi:hypothetical protein
MVLPFFFPYFDRQSSTPRLTHHPRFVGASAPRRHIRDEGSPLRTGLQGQVLNHLKLRWSRAIGVSVKEKAGHDPVR